MQIHCYPHVSFFPSLNVIVWPYNNDWRTTVHEVVKSQTQLSMMMIYRRAWSLTALPWWLSSKESACQCWRCGFNSWFGKIPWRRKWHPTPVFLPRKSHGQRSLAGCSPWGRKESDRTEHTKAQTGTLLCPRMPLKAHTVLMNHHDALPILTPDYNWIPFLATGMSRSLRLMTRATHPPRYTA